MQSGGEEREGGRRCSSSFLHLVGEDRCDREEGKEELKMLLLEVTKCYRREKEGKGKKPPRTLTLTSFR